jgi:hypothetical protein
VTGIYLLTIIYWSAVMSLTLEVVLTFLRLIQPLAEAICPVPLAFKIKIWMGNLDLKKMCSLLAI